MKNLFLFIIAMMSGLQAVPADGQQFRDLNFEQASPVIDPTDVHLYPYAVTAASALPGWSAYLGNVQQTDVLQNFYQQNTASVDIFGPNYPAAGANGPYSPGVIDGDYSVMLQSGNVPFTTQYVPASIEQSGHVPPAAQSLEFKAYLATPYTAFAVYMNGTELAPVALGIGANYTLYAVDIAPYAGTVSELEFSALVTTEQPSGFELDDIVFSGTAVSPEPSSWILTAVGGLIFAFYGTRPGGRIFAARKCLAHR